MATTFLLQQLVVVAAATFATAAATNGSTMASPPSPTTATNFLHACCGLTEHPDTCYNLLLPYAESFHSSRARVAHTSATIGAARLHRFTKDLESLKLRPTGAGRVADMTVVDCYDRVSARDMYAKEMLGHLDKLASGVKNRRDFSSEKYEALILLGSASSSMQLCIDLLHDAGKQALSTQIAKEVIAGCEDVTLYMNIALSIADAIRF